MNGVAEGGADAVDGRYREILSRRLSRLEIHVDHAVSWVLLCEWVLLIALARFERAPHLAPAVVWFGGAALAVLPIAGLLARHGSAVPRFAAAAAQLTFAPLLAAFVPGRFELTLHAVASLCLLALYRDRRLLWSAAAWALLIHGAYATWAGEAGAVRFAAEAGVWIAAVAGALLVSATRGRRELERWARCEAVLDRTVEAAERQITDRMRELNDRSERFRRLIENTDVVPWELERASGRVLYLAPQFARVFDLQQGDAPRAQFIELLHRDDREPFKAHINQVSFGPQHAAPFIDSRIMTADNRLAHMRSYVAERAVGDDATTVSGVSLNVTAQKQSEFEQLQAQRLESIGRLSAGIAHEINAPAHFIGENIRTLQRELRELLGEQGRDVTRTQAIDLALTQALDGIDRIAKIVEAVQEFSHPQLERTPHDLNRAIAGTVIIAGNEWQHVAEVTTDLDESLPPVPVMLGAFNQVMLNVLVNAAQAVAQAREPGTKGLIALSTRRIADWAEIRVRDTGCGIPEKIRERIFDPYFTTNPAGKGLGQGLAVAHDVIVRKHGGAIWTEPEAPSGTTFIIRLPLAGRARGTAAAPPTVDPHGARAAQPSYAQMR